VRGLVMAMAMALALGEVSAEGQRALPVPRFNQTALARLWTSLFARKHRVDNQPPGGTCQPLGGPGSRS